MWAPRLRILFHVDPDRIGATAELPAATVAAIGREAPLFDGFGLEDPTVSRRQCSVCWDTGTGHFDVTAQPDANLRVGLLGSDGRIADIDGTATLVSGSVIALGDRVLLGVELAESRSADADRLGLVGDSPLVWALRDGVQSVARFNRAALIVGPTGAGKELVARALHAQSPRGEGPFVPVNCAALVDSLVESVLFGHARGAFTGATEAHEGMFVAADGGTLFLDEVAELPMSVQPKLLRVIQEGQVAAVGSSTERKVDVRLVTAMHRDPEHEMSQGRLRPDLFHRISGHRIDVPSLAARAFDVPILFVHFLAELRREHRSLDWIWDAAEHWVPALPMTFFADLLTRPWPGNVRELQNIVEQTARDNLQPGAFKSPLTEQASGAMPILDPALAPRVEDERLADAADLLGMAQKTIAKLFDTSALDEAFASPESDHAAKLRKLGAGALHAKLVSVDYNLSQLAASLRMSRTTLNRLMGDFGLPRAADLPADTIAEALAQNPGDVAASALALRVSPQALKKRMAELDMF